MVARPRRARLDSTACNAFVNSTGRPAELVVTGSGLLADNEATLQAFGLPEQSPRYALVSTTFGVVLHPNGSQGQLSLQGSIGRLRDQIFVAGPDGRAEVGLDLTQLPQPNGAVSAVAGETWYAQAWFRDRVGGVATSNFTSTAAVRFE
ncbi:MAG: hypothetical protein AAGI22_06965 [Planctomycetota bacterium]